jgi:hypothetical protein
MTRRGLLLFGLLLGSLALGASVWLLWPRSAINAENAAKIQGGMTVSEVEAILGGPSRDETAGRGVAIYPGPGMVGWELFFEDLTVAEWLSEECGIWIAFEKKRVVDKKVADVTLRDETMLEMFLRWLGL